MELLIKLGVTVLEFLFFVGCVGSLVVVVISGIEDLETIMEKDVEEERARPIQS